MGTSTRQRTSSSRGRQSLLRILMHRPAMISSAGARITVTVLILLGAADTVLAGLIHLKLWGGSTGYHVIPTIGPLFLVQAIAGVAIGLATAVSRRLFFVLAAAGLMAGTALGLFITIQHGLFGFRETWGAPWVKFTFWQEVAAVVVLLIAAIPLAMARGSKD